MTQSAISLDPHDITVNDSVKDDDCFIVDFDVIDGISVNNKHYNGFSSFNAAAPCRARLHRTNHIRSKLYQSRAKARLGRSSHTLQSVPPSGMQVRNICRQMAAPVSKINHTQVAEGGCTVKIPRPTTKTTKNTSRFCKFSRAGTVKTRGCSGNVGKRGNRSNSRHKLPGNVPQVVYETQTRRVLKTHNRPVSSQQNDSQRNIQDGDPSLHKTSAPNRGTYVAVRPKRRILSHPYKESLQKIHEIHCKRNSVPIQSSTVWPQYCAQNFHENFGPHSGFIEKVPHQGSCIFGRLDFETPLPCHGRQDSIRCSKIVTHAGLAHQFSKIYPGTPYPFRIHWPRVGPTTWHDQTQTSKNPTVEARCENSATRGFHQSQETGKHCGDHKMDGSLRANGPHASQETPVENQGVLVAKEGRVECKDLCNKISAGAVKVVDSPNKHFHRSTSEGPKAIRRNFHGCILSWLRGHNGRQDYVRDLDKMLQRQTHQRTGVGSSQAGAANICAHCGELHSKGTFGQLHYSGVPKETRQPQIQNFEQASSKTNVMVCSPQSDNHSCTHSRLQKCGSRCPLKEGSDPCVRVVPEHEGVQQGGNVVETTTTMDGLNGHGQQQTNGLFHKPVPPCERSSSRCSQHSMELQGHPVALPTDCSDDESSQQNQRNRQYSSDLDSPRPPVETLVPRPHCPNNGEIPDSGQESGHNHPVCTSQGLSSDHGEPRTAQTQSLVSAQRLAHGPTHAMSESESDSETVNPRNPTTPAESQAGHLPREDFIKEALASQGFDDTVIPFVVKPQRDSSCSVYDSHWNKFQKFCSSKGWDPRLTNPQRMCTYLVHLFHEGYAINSIENTHSGLRSVLRHFGYPQILPGPVKDCIASLWKARPRERKICTDWNVNHVMDSFLKPPYVDAQLDDSNICLRLFTIKTAFLTAMACSRRKSELHAFSRAKGFFRSESKPSGEVVLSIHTSPGFVAKNQKAKNLYPKVTLRSLFHEFPDSPEEALLCPVRAILRYLERTKDFPNTKNLLFVNPDRSKSTTASSMACWLKAAISTAYKQSDSSPHCTPHEIRAVSTSLSAFNYASVEDILEAGTWSHYSTFVDNYLKDVWPSDSDGTSSLRIPLFVAAGNRITNS